MADSDALEADAPDAPSAANLGVKLRKAREAKNLSLEAVSSELRISTNFLGALEECRFEVLGARVFAKGYLKQYAARLGLDVAEIVADFERMGGAPNVEIAPSKSIRLRDERQITFLGVAAFALLAVGGILAAWWYLSSDPAEAPSTAAVPIGGETRADFEPLPPPLTERAANIPTASPADSVNAEEAPAASVGISATGGAAPEATAAAQPRDTSASTPDATNAVPAASEPAAVIELAPDYTGPRLEIVFVEDSWAEVRDEASRLFYQLGRAGTRVSLPADRDLNVFFGNAAGVELSVAGEPLPIPPSARRGELAQFDIAAHVDSVP